MSIRSGSPCRSFHVANDVSFDGRIDVDAAFKMMSLLARMISDCFCPIFDVLVSSSSCRCLSDDVERWLWRRRRHRRQQIDIDSDVWHTAEATNGRKRHQIKRRRMILQRRCDRRKRQNFVTNKSCDELLFLIKNDRCSCFSYFSLSIWTVLKSSLARSPSLVVPWF